MRETSIFRSKEEELQRLIQEIADIKSTLKDVSSTIGRIERHVKRSFGVVDRPKRSKNSTGSEKIARRSKALPTITPERALTLFDELSVISHKEGYQEIEKKLQSMTVPDLKLMAYELGIAFPARPSKKALFLGIIGRLNEREMLSKNINITSSQKEQMQKNEKEHF